MSVIGKEWKTAVLRVYLTCLLKLESDGIGFCELRKGLSANADAEWASGPSLKSMTLASWNPTPLYRLYITYLQSRFLDNTIYITYLCFGHLTWHNFAPARLPNSAEVVKFWCRVA